MNEMCSLSTILCAISAAGGAAKGFVGSTIGGAVSSAWQQVCQSFADAATQLLMAFAKAFAAIPDVSLTSPGIRSVYGISLGIAVAVAALLLIGQVIRTALTHDGSALATGLTGVAKAALASLFTLAVATAGLAAADTITTQIVNGSFGSAQALSARLGNLLGGATAGNSAVGTGVSAALLLVFGIIGILLVVVLWFELLLRNAAIAVLIATSPIAAAGQVSQATKVWWSKLVAAVTQLIILKPVIALVFAVGLGLAGQPGTIENLLTGMLVLLLAVFAWPAIARFFTFASVQVAGGSGLAAMLGFAAGRMSGSGYGVPAGIEPGEFSRRAEQRTMSRMSGLAGDDGAAPQGLGPAGMASAPGGGAAAGGLASAAGPAAIAIAGARMAQHAINTVTGRMEQTAGYAGMQANPYAQPAGQPTYRTGSTGYRQPAAAGTPGAADTGDQAAGQTASQPPPPAAPPATAGSAAASAGTGDAPTGDTAPAPDGRRLPEQPAPPLPGGQLPGAGYGADPDIPPPAALDETRGDLDEEGWS